MKKKNLDRLIELLSCTQDEIWEEVMLVAGEAVGMDKVYPHRRWIIVEGTAKVGCLSHMDTYDKQSQAFYHPVGDTSILYGEMDDEDCVLGADDRVGVYAMLEHFLHMENRPHLIFTTDEEQGCIGARHLIENIEMYPLMQRKLKECYAFIQIDRRNDKDCVFYNQEQEAFTKYVESFGFTHEKGSFSDVGVIGKHFDICGVNLSGGFRREHTRNESLNLDALEATITKAKEMIDSLASTGTQWKLKPDPPKTMYTLSKSKEVSKPAVGKPEYKGIGTGRYASDCGACMYCIECGEELIFYEELMEGYCTICIGDSYSGMSPVG